MKAQRLIIFTVIVGIAVVLSNHAQVTAQMDAEDLIWVSEVNKDLERRDTELEQLIERNNRKNTSKETPASSN